MKNLLVVGLSLALFMIKTSTWGGLYPDDYYDNSRFREDFQRSDDLFAHAVGVSCQKLPGDPMPYIGGFITQRTVVTVDPSYQKILWNYYDTSSDTYGIRDFTNGLCYPRSIALTSSGELYISDTGNHRVIKMQAVFGTNGLNMQWIKTFGRIGTGEGRFINSFELAVGENPLRVFVSDWSKNDVQMFDGDGNYLQTIGSYGDGPGQFYGPRGLVVAGDATLYVADTGNERVQRFRYNEASAGYIFDKEIKTSENGPMPKGAKLTHVALGSHQIFIVDEQNEQIYLLDGSMNYLATYRGNPGSPFRKLRNLCVPPPSGTWSTCQALSVETDRIQMLRIGMDVLNTLAEPAVFYPLAPEKNTTNLKYTLTEDGWVSIYIYDSSNNIVRNLLRQSYRTIGTNVKEWDGKDNNGNILPGGTYQYLIVAADANGYEGHAVMRVHKTVPVIIHQTPIVTISTANPSVLRSGMISQVDYSLSMNGVVEAKVVDGQGNVIRLLKDGNGPLEPAGLHNVQWNGAYNDDYWNHPQDGYYWIRIRAKDSAGYWGLEKQIRVALANAPPAVKLDLPANSTFGLNAPISGSIGGFLLSSYDLSL